MHRHISRRLHPFQASQDARRPQGRVAAEAASKTTKAAAGADSKNTALGSDGQGQTSFSPVFWIFFWIFFDFLIFLFFSGELGFIINGARPS
jgi:hypothetical protein